MNHVDQKEVTVCDWTEVIDDLTLRVAAHTKRNTRTVVLLRPGYTYVQEQVRVSGVTACKTPVSAGMGGQALSVMVGNTRIAVFPPAGG